VAYELKKNGISVLFLLLHAIQLDIDIKLDSIS